MSGAGKSVVLKALEDLGVFAVDNLPLMLLPQLAELYQESGHRLNQIAIGVDIRSGALLDEFTQSVQSFARRGIKYQILFLDADDPVLLRRFSETRRRHPLGRRVIEGIQEERRRLQDVRAQADKIIDTSQLTPSTLKEALANAIKIQKSRGMTVTLLSFGYKYGPPLDADLMLDVRFLPNPNYIPSLKHQNGTMSRVKKYVLQFPAARKFLRSVENLLKFTLPEYQKEGKSYLTLAVGCTGGHHRSVVIAEEIGHALQREGTPTRIYHRDIARGA
jgi:UPF0042 nucleotide-binding protein